MFRNHRAEYLEREMLWREERFDRHLADVQSLHQTLQYEAMRELAAVKKAHAEELTRAINEIQKLQDDYQRLLLTLHPVIQDVQLPKERAEERELTPVFSTPTGTPWQRIQARWQQQQDEEWAKKHTKPADVPVQGENKNGNAR